MLESAPSPYPLRPVRTPDPSAFVDLPLPLAKSLGIVSRQGARMQAALLSGLAHAMRSAAPEGGTITLTYDRKHVVGIDEGHVWTSLQHIAEDLYVRFVHAAPYGDHFDTFYRRIARAAAELRAAGLLVSRRAVEGTDKYGLIASLPTLPAETCRTLPVRPDPGCVLTRSVAMETAMNASTGSAPVNVLDLIGGVYVWEGLPEPLARRTDARSTETAEVRFCGVRSHAQPTRFLDAHRFAARHGRTSKGREVFTSVGTWLRSHYVRRKGMEHAREAGYEGRDERRVPVFYPWLVLDIECGDDAYEAHEKAVRVLGTMADRGVDIARVVAYWTGGRGFHIRVPSGMFGNPVFKSAFEGERVMRRFALELCDEDTDPCVFNPIWMLRAMGSKHGASGCYARPMSGDEFLAASLQEVLERGREKPTEADERMAGADPRTVLPAWEVLEMFMDALDATRRTPLDEIIREALPKRRMQMSAAQGATDEAFVEQQSGGDERGAESGAVVQRALAGVGQAEEWMPGHVGRDKAVFVAACHFLRRGLSGHRLTAALEEVADRCVPAFPHRQIRGRIASAMRTTGIRA